MALHTESSSFNRVNFLSRLRVGQGLGKIHWRNTCKHSEAFDVSRKSLFPSLLVGITQQPSSNLNIGMLPLQVSRIPDSTPRPQSHSLDLYHNNFHWLRFQWRVRLRHLLSMSHFADWEFSEVAFRLNQAYLLRIEFIFFRIIILEVVFLDISSTYLL